LAGFRLLFGPQGFLSASASLSHHPPFLLPHLDVLCGTLTFISLWFALSSL
jgi:hypothetical protein